MIRDSHSFKGTFTRMDKRVETAGGWRIARTMGTVFLIAVYVWLAILS